jgi:hypothetical protein
MNCSSESCLSLWVLSIELPPGLLTVRGAYGVDPV